jgi:hypothetical protein
MGMGVELTVQLFSPLRVIKQDAEVASTLPKAEESFGSVGLSSGIAMMIDRESDKASLCQAVT